MEFLLLILFGKQFPHLIKMLKGVIFDMDGLMFDTERLSSKMWHKILTKYSLPINEEFIIAIRGLNFNSSKELFYKCYQTKLDFKSLKEEKNQMVFAYITSHGIPVKEGLYELLDFLKKNKIKIALATSSSRAVANKNLELAGIDSYFNAKVFGDEVSKGKPDPEIFLKALAKLHLTCDESIVLEDSKNGINAALSAGISPLWIPDGVYFETKANNLFLIFQKVNWALKLLWHQILLSFMVYQEEQEQLL